MNEPELFADSHRGIYIPQHFAQTVKREIVSGVSEEDYQILEMGPEHDLYWDTWINVTDNAQITIEDGTVWYLYQDGDLWIVPRDYDNDDFFGEM